VYIEGQSASLATASRHASWNRVSPEYFQTIGTSLLRGRTITEQDTPTSPRVAVVNQAFVERFFQGGVDPLGKHFGIGAAGNSNSYEIVGVVADAKYWNTDHAVPMFFVPFLQLTPYTDARFEKTDIRSNYARNIELDVQGNSPGPGKAIRGALTEIDPDLPVLGIRTFDEQIRTYFNHQELVAQLSGVLGMLALLVATLGVYAVTSYSVARRTNEIGIRMALGSNRRRVIFMVLGSTFAQISIGLALGIPAALLVCRLLANQLYGVSNSDPLSYAIACALLASFSLIAASVPARRAAKVDPMEALRCE
jgi:macrolide transport system ATP-binding/permease protein